MSSMGGLSRRNDSGPAGRAQTDSSKPGKDKTPGRPKIPPGKTWLWFLAILIANYLVMKFLLPSPEAPVTVPYTFFKEEVSKRNVESIYSQGESITGRFKSPVTYSPGEKRGT